MSTPLSIHSQIRFVFAIMLKFKSFNIITSTSLISECNYVNTMIHYHIFALIYEDKLSPKHSVEEFKI